MNLIFLYFNSENTIYILGYEPDKMSDEQFKRKLQLCEEVLKVLDKIMPGQSRKRGMIKYELHLPLVMLTNKQLQNAVPNSRGNEGKRKNSQWGINQKLVKGQSLYNTNAYPHTVSSFNIVSWRPAVNKLTVSTFSNFPEPVVFAKKHKGQVSWQGCWLYLIDQPHSRILKNVQLSQGNFFGLFHLHSR